MESPPLRDRNTHTTYVPNLSIRPHNSFCEVEWAMVGQHVRNSLFHERAVFRVYKSQIFFYCWRLPTRFKTMDPKQLGGPVFESSCVEGLTSHVGNALPFTDMGLASLKRFLGAFAIFNVGHDPIPLDDVPSSSRSGTPRSKCQRYCPSARRKRTSFSCGLPVATASIHLPACRSRSSG